MYQLCDYGFMIGPENRARTEAYAKALQRAIGPATIVLEIGTGAGFFALLACKFGARHVYAIEPNHAIHVGREAAVANGMADRITFLQATSRDVDLPDRADVIVSDLGGALPLCDSHIPDIVDARRRLLKAGGTLIPQVDKIWAAVVGAAKFYHKLVGPWQENAYGLDFSAGRKRIVNSPRKLLVRPEQVLLPPSYWATLDYRTIETPNVSEQLVWTAGRDGTAHGVTLWFDETLAEGITLSNAPGAPVNPIYSNMFFPFQWPIDLARGDEVSIDLRADFVKGRTIWSWNTTVVDTKKGAAKAQFKQSTFTAAPLFTTAQAA